MIEKREGMRIGRMKKELGARTFDEEDNGLTFDPVDLDIERQNGMITVSFFVHGHLAAQDLLCEKANFLDYLLIAKLFTSC